MYHWIWEKLPGNAWVKAACCVVLVVAFAFLLWFFIFPWAEQFLPFGDVTVA